MKILLILAALLSGNLFMNREAHELVFNKTEIKEFSDLLNSDHEKSIRVILRENVKSIVYDDNNETYTMTVTI